MKYEKQKEYLLEIAGLTRKLPIVEIKKDKLWVASFVMLGDTELNYRCAEELIRRFPNESFDYIVVPEAKAVPLIQSMCQILEKDYIVLRKGVKAYMEFPTITELKSITTKEKQRMVINGLDARKIKNKNVYLIDDVISTGESYRAMMDLVNKVEANIKFAGVILKEGNFDISDIEDRIGKKIVYLEKLPLFEQ